MSLTDLLTPADVLEQVAKALPPEVRAHVIIIGSLAAGYHFFGEDGAAAIRTKDVDCLLSPHAKAVSAAAVIAQEMRKSHWTQREDAQWGKPGDPSTATEILPMVRLKPPSADGWFLELLSAPPQYQLGQAGKRLERIRTDEGDYAICSFGYLSLVEYMPLETPYGIRVARPEMMALANMLHHPAIGDDVIGGTSYKRSNKDLGRVLALAHLAIMRDRKNGTDEFAQWPITMWHALTQKFESHAGELARHAGTGISQLMASPGDQKQALEIANRGLLASLDIGLPAINATANRLQVEVIEELASMSM